MLKLINVNSGGDADQQPAFQMKFELADLEGTKVSLNKNTLELHQIGVIAISCK